jgi:hypothetical protein
LETFFGFAPFYRRACAVTHSKPDSERAHSARDQEERAMSIADHFEPVQEAGFTQGIDPDAARRQFNMSAGLAAVLGVVALAVSFLAPMKPVEVSRERLQMTVQAPQKVQVRHAAQDARQFPGG